jgi:hypothetical protein
VFPVQLIEFVRHETQTGLKRDDCFSDPVLHGRQTATYCFSLIFMDFPFSGEVKKPPELTCAKIDHFAGAGKMMRGVISCGLTGCLFPWLADKVHRNVNSASDRMDWASLPSIWAMRSSRCLSI